MSLIKTKSGIVGSLVVFVMSWSVAGFAHPKQSRVELTLDQASPYLAGAQNISFKLVDTKKKKQVKDGDLNVMHEKLIHFFIFDEALVEFRHVHPEFDGSSWVVKEPLDLPLNGNYRVWAQGELKVDGSEFATTGVFEIQKGQPANGVASSLGDQRTGTDGISRATLSKEKLVSGKMVMPTLKIDHTDGSPVQLTDFLGAPIHIVAVTMAGDDFLHVHPMTMGSNKFMMHAEFPEAGDYRIWVQFIDGGDLKTVPISVTVQ